MVKQTQHAVAGVAGRVRAGARRRFWERMTPLVHQRYFDDLVNKTENFADVTWLGNPIWQNVLDLWALQEAISEVRPAVLLETGTNRGGSALFFASLFDLLGQGRVVTVDVERFHGHQHPRVEFLLGSSVAPDVMARMGEVAAEADGPVMVVLDSDHAEAHVAAELEAYAPLVTSGSIMLCQDGVIDTLPQFWQGRPGPLPAIRRFLADHPEFTLDERYDERFLVTHHPAGWLRRS